jgi:hypothetical protein
MEEIRTKVKGIRNLVVLLLVHKEELEDRKEVDPSNGSISKTLLAIKQLSKKLETILDNKEPRTSEELEIEVCKSK